MKRTKIAATCALFVLLCLLGAGCGAPTRRANSAPDTPCSTCTKAACSVEANACLANAACQRLLVCVAAEGQVCGPAPQHTFREVAACEGISPSMACAVDALRELAAAGIHQAEAARRCGVSPAIIRRLAQRHRIVFKAAPPPTREHFRDLGRKSAASPLHHVITDEARRAAHRTRHERSR